MANRARPRTSLVRTVRTRYVLTQEELARYLEVTPGQVAHAEADRRELGHLPLQRLAQLVALPEPAEAEPPAAEPLTEEERADLEFRRKVCQAKALTLRLELRKAEERAAAHQRRLRALAFLRRAWHAEVSPLPAAIRVFADPAHDRAWLAYLERVTARTPPPPSATARALLALRIRLFDEEAAALAELLA